MPSEAELERYNAAYFDNAHGGLDAAQSAAPFHAAINRLRVEHVERLRGQHGVAVQRVLEIGPGLGDFAAHWLALHPGTEYHVVESDANARAALAARGVSVHSTVDTLPRDFDLLVMSHVLEHIAAPRDVLTALSARLRPGALVFIEVPCRDHEHKNEDEPHLLFFDRSPMARLLDRSGIEPMAISYHGVEIDRLRGGRFTRRSFARRVMDRLVSIGDRRGLLPVPAGLRGIDDPRGIAAVRPFEAHLEKREPSWWLRAVGCVREGARIQ
jgi:SAM-dependent methyltransferase